MITEVTCLVLVSISGALGRVLAPLPTDNVCSGPHLELLVSPVVEDGYIRRITFEWDSLPSGAEIGIFNADPTVRDVAPIFSYTPTVSSSWANSTLEEPHVNAEDLQFQAACVNYYIAYKINDKWSGVSCLRTEPTWMNDLKDIIGTKKLKNLYIPGTHDSSAYKEYDRNNPDDFIMKYSVTQDETVLAQLLYGARYIDLRVGYYPNFNQVWWGNHGILQFHPMNEIIANLTEFLRYTNEIVILDVQEFPVGFGDDKKVHRLFIDYLKEKLSDYMVSSKLTWDATLNDVWKSGQLIIGYDDSEMVNEFDFLWPAVNQNWGNVQHAEDLMSYLEGVVANNHNSAWSAMAQLTPTAQDIVLNTMGGLRHAAEAVNHDVTKRFRTADWAKNTNVVAMDFIRGSGIVQAAIEWNRGAGPCETRREKLKPHVTSI